MNTFNHIITNSVTHPITTAINIVEDNVIWEDPDLDFVIVEPTTMTIPIASTSFPSPSEFSDETDIISESSTIPPESLEHFDLIEDIHPSSTIAGGVAVAEQDPQMNWWDINEASFTPLTESTNSPLTTTTTATNTLKLIPSMIKLTNIEDEWAIFNTSSIPSFTQSEHPSELDFNINDYVLFPAILATPTIDSINNNTPPFVPYYFTDYKTKEELLDLLNPVPTLGMPPFAWMLYLASQNKSELKGRKNFINKNFTIISSTITPKMKKMKRKKIYLKKSLNNNLDRFSEYCNKKQCQHGGRLNADCLCICLPAFSGINCERGKDI